MTHTDSLRTIADLGPGDHLCCIYETEEEHRAAVVPFLRQGLERGEKVVYIVDARASETILGYLRDDGLDVESCLAGGQLTILTRDDTYMRGGTFDPEGMIGLLSAETEQALAQGYPALRVTGEMTWALQGLAGSERLIEYEARLNDFFPGSQCLAICQYDRRRFEPEVLLDVLRTHPTAIIGREVYYNFYYIPASGMLGEDRAAEELRAYVQHLGQRKQADEELRRHREHLEELIVERTAELAIALERAQKADRIKSAFLGTMSHELRTSLNSIIGFTGILLQGLAGPLNPEQQKQLNMVYDSAKHLLALINDVLDISKIEAGQLEIVSEPFDMRQAIEKVVQTVTPLAEKKGLVLLTRVAPEVGRITSDRRRVEQILINLVNNAIKFTPGKRDASSEQGRVRIECEVSDGWLVTRVADTGIGIKPEGMDTLFEAFRQIDTGLTRRHEGTGLGLSICKRLVEMLGGEIWVESKWGVGSTFIVTLPAEI